MFKLLNEGYSRIIKGKLLWAVAAFAVLAAIVYPLIMHAGKIEEIDDVFFMFAVGVPFVAAIFVSVFVGTEYSDGTVRNKLICGHRRVNVYLSGLVISLSVVIMLCLLYTAVSAAVAVPLIGKFASGKLAMRNLAFTLLTGVCFTCVFVCTCYLVKNRTAAAITCLVAALALIVISICIGINLTMPPTVTQVEVDELGNYIYHEIPNPRRMSDAVRSFCLFLMEFLPSGPAVVTAFFDDFSGTGSWTVNYTLMAIYQVIIAVGASAAGAVIFRIKDIK